MKYIRGFVMAVGVIGILAIIALFLGYFLYSLTPPIQGKMTPVAVSADAAKSFDKKVDTLQKEIKEASEARQEKQVAITITEGEVNSKLTELLAETALPMGITKLSINFRENQFLLYTVVDVPGVAAKIGVAGNIKVVNGKPQVTIQDLDIGKLPLPKSTYRRAEDLLDLVLRIYLTDLPIKISSVNIGSRQIVVSAVTVPIK